MNKAASSRFRNFMHQLNGVPFEQRFLSLDEESTRRGSQADLVPYFGLKLRPQHEQLHIHLGQDATGCLLSVHYYAQPSITALNEVLPPDVCRMIADFAYNHLRLQFKISFPSDYPFNPPIWALASVDSSIPFPSAAYGGMTLPDYYAYLVDMHNGQYRQTRQCGLLIWSPALTIEKDVLLFVRRIHHFSSIAVAVM